MIFNIEKALKSPSVKVAVRNSLSKNDLRLSFDDIRNIIKGVEKDGCVTHDEYSDLLHIYENSKSLKDKSSLRSFLLNIRYIKKELRWCDLRIDTREGKITVLQKWDYKWLTAHGVSGWTPGIKEKFHKLVKSSIMRVWSNINLKLEGSSSLCEQFDKKGMFLEFDIRRVSKDCHWSVKVTRLKKSTKFQTSRVLWKERIILLDTKDANLTNKKNNYTGLKGKQTPVAHEFAHTIGNSYRFNNGDEYSFKSPHLQDTNSILNVGDKVRERHLDKIIKELNSMVSDTKFSVKSIG